MTSEGRLWKGSKLSRAQECVSQKVGFDTLVKLISSWCQGNRLHHRGTFQSELQLLCGKREIAVGKQSPVGEY